MLGHHAGGCEADGAGLGGECGLCGAVVVGFMIHCDLVAAERIAERDVRRVGKLAVVVRLLAVFEQGLLVEVLDVGVHLCEKFWLCF